MDATTLILLGIGGLGVLVLSVGLLGFDLDGPVPTEVIAAMLGAFGFAGAIASAALESRTPLPLLTAMGAGALAAVPAGWLAARLVRAVRRMPTDATPVRDDLVGLIGVVVTPIPRQGYGEVRVTLGGQPVKLNARSAADVPLGERVFVVTAPSDTSVVVERLSTIDPRPGP
jgi:membrane protein implicated in regulation of membrane protease activity